MGSKNNPGAHDCYGAALPDEPMFTLLARDASAPDLIRQWASRRAIGCDSTEESAKINEAMVCASAMELWRVENWPARKGEQVKVTTVDREVHDARVTELLQVNNREVERRRAAERRIAELERSIAVLMQDEPADASVAEAEA